MVKPDSTLRKTARLPHFYRSIGGWFDFQKVYREQVKNAKNGQVFVEVGAYKGKSAAFMAVENHNSGKQIEFHVVDIWSNASHKREFVANVGARFSFVRAH